VPSFFLILPSLGPHCGLADEGWLNDDIQATVLKIYLEEIAMTNAPHATIGSPKRDATEPFSAMAQNGSAHTKEVFEKMSAATADAAALIKSSYSTAVKGGQDYNNKVLEFARTNTEAAFGFAQKLTTVKSPSDFMELSTEHSRKQFETLTEQTKELAALAQKVTLATTEPLRAGVTKTFSQLA
jgi:phasin